MKEGLQAFGGDWTEKKLEVLRKYLWSYATILAKRHYRFDYIDAFAGTGYREARYEHEPTEFLIPELAESEPQRFLDGSARIALSEERFNRYIFVEQIASIANELRRLELEFPKAAGRIEIVIEDANSYLQRICGSPWPNRRALVFIDPFAMQVEWKTITAIARTEAIDMWLLFPLGAVNRLLRRDGEIDEAIRQRLSSVFGTEDWFDEIYSVQS